MLLVVDFNVVFSALVTRSKSRLKLLSLSKLPRGEISEVLEFIKRSAEIMPFKVFEDKAKEAMSLAPHLKDVPYVARSSC